MRATWLADVLRNAGVDVVEMPGWESRGLGDFAAIKGVILHHTAGPKSGNSPSLNIVANGRPGLPGPLSQLFLARDGTFYVIASGRSNHAGSGYWQGVSSGNSNFLGIEAENAGTGKDPWPDKQITAYVTGVAAILRYLKLDDVWAFGHKEWALPRGRKVDPAFDMVDFREAVASMIDLLNQTGGEPPPMPTHRTPRPTDPTRSMLMKGHNGNSVKLLQERLNAVANAGIKVDGDFGPATERAVNAFQKARGLTVDGKVGPKTWEALGVK